MSQPEKEGIMSFQGISGLGERSTPLLRHLFLPQSYRPPLLSSVSYSP